MGIIKDKNLSPKFGDSLSSFLFEQELLVVNSEKKKGGVEPV